MSGSFWSEPERGWTLLGEPVKSIHFDLWTVRYLPFTCASLHFFKTKVTRKYLEDDTRSWSESTTLSYPLFYHSRSVSTWKVRSASLFYFSLFIVLFFLFIKTNTTHRTSFILFYYTFFITDIPSPTSIWILIDVRREILHSRLFYVGVRDT